MVVLYSLFSPRFLFLGAMKPSLSFEMEIQRLTQAATEEVATQHVTQLQSDRSGRMREGPTSK